ncbi:MAG: TauD/TfdA family dioxygenase [Rhodospirillales bacterium]|jgi:taurine dioxygenase
MDYRHIKVEPLTPVVGAMISGVDLGNLSSEDMIDEISSALWQFHVLFFRDQEMSPEAQSRLGKMFGEVTPHEFMRPLDDHPNVHITDHEGHGPSGNAHWHTDVTFRKRPNLVTILQPIELPKSGGDTLWCSTGAAFDALPAPMKTMLLSLSAEHDMPFHMRRLWSCLRSADGGPDAANEAEFKQIRENPIVVHPAVINHPVTGRLTLYVNSNWTKKFIDMDLDMSDHLLAALFDWVKRPDFQVRFQWKMGSIGIFDNFATQHYAVVDYAPEYRAMQRVIAGNAEPTLDLSTVAEGLRPPDWASVRQAAE